MMCEKNRERRKRSKNACGRYLPKWKGRSNVISKSNSKSVEKLNGYPLATAMLFFFLQMHAVIALYSQNHPIR